MPGVILAIVILLGYFIFYQIRAHVNPTKHEALLEGKICVWCGKPIEDGQPIISSSKSGRLLNSPNNKSHLACDEQAFAKNRRYYLIFFVMTIIAAIILISIIATDIVNKEKVDWILPSNIVLFVYAVLYLKHTFIQPWEQKIKEAKNKM